jgi:hypothetical protein
MRGCWEVAPVDRSQDYFEVRYGNLSKDPPDPLATIALVGRGSGACFSVEWLVSPADLTNQGTIEDAEAAFDFYLVEMGEPDTWGYMKYHTTTASNLYSRVHWAYHSKHEP